MIKNLIRANLPTHTEVSVLVLADEAWVQEERLSLDQVRDLLAASITSAGSSLVTIQMVDFRNR